MIVALFVAAIGLFIAGILLATGRYRYVVQTDEAGNPALSRKQLRLIAGTAICIGGLVAVAAGLALFTDRPYVLMDLVFRIFT